MLKVEVQNKPVLFAYHSLLYRTSATVDESRYLVTAIVRDSSGLQPTQSQLATRTQVNWVDSCEYVNEEVTRHYRSFAMFLQEQTDTNTLIGLVNPLLPRIYLIGDNLTKLLEKAGHKVQALRPNLDTETLKPTGFTVEGIFPYATSLERREKLTFLYNDGLITFPSHRPEDIFPTLRSLAPDIWNLRFGNSVSNQALPHSQTPQVSL